MTSSRTVGIVLVVWAILGVLAVGGLLVLFSMPWFAGDTWSAPSLDSPLAIFAAIGLAGAALSLVAGVGLLAQSTWSRPVALAACVVSLGTFPIGSAVGVYGLVVLLSKSPPAA